MSRRLRIYPHLLTVPASTGAKQHPELIAIMDHAVELAQCSVPQRTEELCALKGGLPDHVYHQRKNGPSNSLRKLGPGAAHKIEAVLNQARNRVVTEPSAGARVSDRRETNASLRANWPARLSSRMMVSKQDLIPTINDV